MRRNSRTTDSAGSASRSGTTSTSSSCTSAETSAKSDFPDELLTIDYNSQGRIIGIEALGSIARRGAEAIILALLEAKELAAPEAVKESLSSLLAT